MSAPRAKAGTRSRKRPRPFSRLNEKVDADLISAAANARPSCQTYVERSGAHPVPRRSGSSWNRRWRDVVPDRECAAGTHEKHSPQTSRNGCLPRSVQRWRMAADSKLCNSGVQLLFCIKNLASALSLSVSTKREATYQTERLSRDCHHRNT